MKLNSDYILLGGAVVGGVYAAYHGYYGLSATLLFPVAAIGIGKMYYDHFSPEKLGAKYDKDPDEYRIKKYPEVEIRRQSALFAMMGCTVALGFTLMAFNWNIAVEPTMLVTEDPVDDWREVTPPIIKHREKLPPPPEEIPEVKTKSDQFEIVEEVGDLTAEAPDFPEADDKIDLTGFDTGVEEPEPDPIEDPVIVPIPEPVLFVSFMPKYRTCETTEFADNEEQQTMCSNKALLAFLYDHMEYPVLAKEHGIEGVVFVSFVVNTKGEVEDIKSLRPLGYGFDEEVIRAVKLLEGWIPGNNGGQAVPVRLRLPVRFQLE